MDGHARTVGMLTQTATVGGKRYTIRPFTVGVLPEMEAYIISKREDPIIWATRACLIAPDDQHERIWRIAQEASNKNRTVTTAQSEEFRNSLEGGAFVFWVCVRADHPEVKTPQDALQIMLSATEDELTMLKAAVFVGSGEHDLGNSTGPQQGATENPAAAAVGQ